MKRIKFINLLLFSAIILLYSCSDENMDTNELVIEESTPVFDFDGNSYKTVKIGNQIWMAENLKTTHYSDGTPIQNFVYNNEEVNASNYGRLYRWSAAMRNSSGSNTNPSGIQGVSPEGWHIPSIKEWLELVNNLGGNAIAGGKLKELGIEYWQTPNTNATNESLFNARPGGMYAFWLEFQWINQHSVFATSTDVSVPGHPAVSAIKLDYNTEKVTFGEFHPDDAISVRCIKD